MMGELTSQSQVSSKESSDNGGVGRGHGNEMEKGGNRKKGGREATDVSKRRAGQR